MRRSALVLLCLCAGPLASCGGAGAATSGSSKTTSRSASTAATPPSAAALAAVRRADDGFAGRILAAVSGARAVVLSPFSISEAFALLDPAARGATAQEIGRAFGFTVPATSVARAFGTLDRSLAGANRSGVTVSVANSLWGQQGFAFKPAFLSVLADELAAPLQRTDFGGAPAAALSTINHWVASKTAGKITNLLSAADVTPQTRLVLVNAIYLNAKWASPFAHSDTAPAAFDGAGGVEHVPTMRQDGSFPYARGHGYAVAELPYVGGRLAFDVVLPDAGKLDTVLAAMRRSGPSRLIGSLHETQLALSLPKLLLRTRVELAAPLKALGLRTAFEPGVADLSGAAGRPGGLYVAAAVHEAYLKVDEEGTEAAAATGIVLGPTAALQTLQFDVNRPFVFLLRDRTTGSVLFAGVVRRV